MDFDLVGKFISNIGNVGLGIANTILQKKNADRNYAAAQSAQQWQENTDQRNYDYMVATQQQEWARADTAHQREVADLKAAGLSPLASMQGSTTGQIVNQNGVGTPVVPQWDGSSLASAVASTQNALGVISSAYTQKDLQAKQLAYDLTVHQDNINLAFSQLEEQQYEFDENISLELTKWQDTVTYQTAMLTESIEARKSSEKQAMRQQLADEVMSLTGGHASFKVVKTDAEADAHNKIVLAQYDSYITKELPKLVKTLSSSSSSESNAYNGSVNVGAPKKVEKLLGHADVGLSLGYSDADSSSSTYSNDSTALFEELKSRFWLSHQLAVVEY